MRRKKESNAFLQEMDKLANLYEGVLPPEYEQYFPQSVPKHVVNYIRLAWDDLAQSVARNPEIQAHPENSTNLALRKSQTLENIALGYIKAARPTDGLFLFQNAWNLVGLGAAVSVVVPCTESRSPRLEPRDPRTALPGAKRKIGPRIVDLNDIIFVHRMSREDAAREGWIAGNEGAGEVEVYEYIDAKNWVMAGPDKMVKAEHGLGMVPAVYMQTFSPNKGGISQFAEQVSLMVAVSRIISQKMAYIDRVIYPMLWVKGHEGELKIGPQVINKLSQDGEMGQLSPPVQLQVDRDIATLERFQRILNRNPEVRQGEADGKGAYVGAKTLESLNDAVQNDIGRYWDSIQSGYEKLLAAAFEMDEKLFDEEKTISVITKGQRNVVKYTPSKDIAGRREVSVQYGWGIGNSYQAFVEAVDAYKNGLLPKRYAVEAAPGRTDSNRMLRELELEQMDEIAFTTFVSQAQQGMIDMEAWVKYRTKMAEEGLSWHEAYEEYTAEVRRKEQAAAEQPLPGQALPQEAGGLPVAAQEQLPGLPAPAMLGV